MLFLIFYDHLMIIKRVLLPPIYCGSVASGYHFDCGTQTDLLSQRDKLCSQSTKKVLVRLYAHTYHYTNMPMQYTAILKAVKTIIFR